MLLTDLAEVLGIVIKSLNSRPKSQYLLYGGLFEMQEILDVDVVCALHRAAFIQGIGQIEVTPDLQEKYVDLMCRIEPAAVCDYLRYTKSASAP